MALGLLNKHTEGKGKERQRAGQSDLWAETCTSVVGSPPVPEEEQTASAKVLGDFKEQPLARILQRENGGQVTEVAGQQ